MSESTPEQFGKYELLKRLAFGGMAEIFLARLRGEGGFSKQLVVKRILPQFGEDPQFVKMFIDEAVLAAHINHPNVVQIYDFGSTDKVYFIAMEYVDGADLREIIKNQRTNNASLSFAEVAAIGEGVAAGLASAHAAVDADGTHLQIVHRDVSPHNVMIGRSGDVKVMDFGIARAEVRATKTATGTIKGKVAYMAPEHGAGERADGRSDQFSLGAVIWECLAGERLYGGDSELEVLRNVLDCRTRPIEAVRPDVPGELAAIVGKMLESNPANRFDSMAQVRDALARFRYTLGPDGAIDLGKIVPAKAESTSPRSSGTLVLEEVTTDPQTGEHESVDPGATASWPEGPSSASVTATLPMEGEPTVPYESQSAQDVSAAKPSKLWAAALLLMVFGALSWISYQGEARMERTPPVQVQEVVDSKASLRVVSEPLGAQIYLNGSSTDEITPATVRAGEAGSTLELELRLKGYKIWSRSVLLKAGINEVPANLIKEVEATRRLKPAPSKAAPLAKKSRKKNVQASKKQMARQEMKQPGRLFLRSSGLWFHVYLGDKKIGTTPLAGVTVPAGKHTLTLRNDVAGVEREIQLSVTPGAVIRRTVGAN